MRNIKMNDKTGVTIKTPDGLGIIEGMWISELGFLMLRVYIIDENRWISYNLGIHDTNNNVFNNLVM